MTGNSRYLGLEALSSSSCTGDVGRVLSKLEDAGRAPMIARLVANADAAFRPFILFADALLFRGCLSAELREVVVLRLATLLDLPYVWQEHVGLATASGVTPNQLDALRRDPFDVDCFEPAIVAALGFVDSWVGAGHPSDAATAGVDRHLSRSEKAELLMVVAWWGGLVPRLVNGLGLEASDA